MANRFVSPQQQFISFAGIPYAGGFLYFYVSGTSTPTPTYSDEGLTTPNTNPVQLDSAGDAGSVFLDPGILYKVVLTDSNLNPVWTFDPVIPTDSATGSGFTPIVSCNAAGTNSIVLTPITPSQQPALYSNFQVFAFVPVSTTTGSVSLQVGSLPSESVFVAPGIQAGAGTFIANDGPYYVAYGSLVAGSGPGFLLLNQNIGAIQASLPITPPQGYLTLTSQTPIIITDAVAATNVFWTPLIGLGCPIHNGSSIVSTLLSGQLTLALTTAQVASNIYDIYIAFNGGSPVIGTGPSWAAGTSGSVTPGSCARGTGTGGSALVRTQGIWTNAAAMALTYNLGAGNISLAVPANQGVYLGSIFIDSTAGQVSSYVTYGQSRKRGLWNASNRQPVVIQVGDTTASWTIGGGGSGVYEPLRNTNTNSALAFIGLPEEQVTNASFFELTNTGSANASWQSASGIGWNVTNAASGLSPFVGIGLGSGVSGAISLSTVSQGFYVSPTFIGISTVTALEAFKNGAGTIVGGIANNLMTVSYRG